MDKVIQSFSKPYSPYNNSVIESFFSNLKQEELYRRNYKNKNELLKAIDDYIEFYNGKRPHKANNYLTPNEREKQYYKK
ncbi:integrase core domain-containing protein [Breznakia pachnodae]|uniref:Transposase InsO family protein n=1 Tax=Breznakia pachnodae TaxID=265178 RepID=A0ABU0E0N5_9FIRM|nr:integrase core domain-containing protein [Breznakia pachnodae]MDQ0360467.1 transposase InsO family protein [Breznakia pachnodae]